MGLGDMKILIQFNTQRKLPVHCIMAQLKGFFQHSITSNFDMLKIMFGLKLYQVESK